MEISLSRSEWDRRRKQFCLTCSATCAPLLPNTPATFSFIITCMTDKWLKALPKIDSWSYLVTQPWTGYKWTHTFTTYQRKCKRTNEMVFFSQHCFAQNISSDQGTVSITGMVRFIRDLVFSLKIKQSFGLCFHPSVSKLVRKLKLKPDWKTFDQRHIWPNKMMRGEKISLCLTEILCQLHNVAIITVAGILSLLQRLSLCLWKCSCLPRRIE